MEVRDQSRLQRWGRLSGLLGMKKFLRCICAVVLMGSCGAASRPGDLTSISPSPSTTEVQPRLWVSAQDGGRSVSGFVERSDTGMSIRYELEMKGPVLAVTVSERAGTGTWLGSPARRCTGRACGRATSTFHTHRKRCRSCSRGQAPSNSRCPSKTVGTCRRD